MRFRRKPALVTAERYLPMGEPPSGVCTKSCGHGIGPHLHFLGRIEVIPPGAWIVVDERGTNEIVLPHEFDRDYEPAGE